MGIFPWKKYIVEIFLYDSVSVTYAIASVWLLFILAVNSGDDD